MQKMSEAAISKASNVSDIVTVNPPMAGGPFFPSTTNNYIFGLLIGLMVPFLLFTVMEMLNKQVQSKEDLEKITRIPFIGGIGHNSLMQNLVAHERPKSPIAESFRAIRSNLNYFTGNQAKKVFMVSSSISGEGKTFTTVNLATVFAMSGRKTLIIGADMRKPKIYADFDLDNHVGLSGYLSSINSLSEVIQPTKIKDLDLISGEPLPPNPSELLLTDKFDALLREALQHYDYIIIDTPPMAIVTDGFIIANRVDHIIFVVRQNVTRSEEHTSELQSHSDLVCRLLLEKKKKSINTRLSLG